MTSQVSDSDNRVSPKLRFWFSVFLALYPILCIYKAVYKFTIGDIILMGFLLLSIVYPIKKDTRLSIVTLFSIYAVTALFINLALSSITATYSVPSLMFRVVKFIFYMFCVFTCARTYFDFKIFRKSISIVAIAASAFLIFQYFMFHVYDKIVLGHIPGLTLYLEEYSILDYERFFLYAFRPSSLFLEPAMFSQFSIVALTLLLFESDSSKGKRRYISIIILTAGILMSTAGQGILYVFVVYVIFGFKRITNRDAMVAFFASGITIGLISYSKISFVQAAVNRLLFSKDALTARLGSYQYAFDLKGLPAFFGHGYGTTPNNEWMSGAAYIWYGCGLVGLVLSIAIFASFYINARNTTARTICFLFFIMFFGTALFYNYMLFWYFAIILCASTPKGDMSIEDSIHSRRI